jgi:biopolymer transport protein ExbD
MNLLRLRELLAAPVAGLLLVLILCVLVERRPQPAVGLRVPMMKLKQHSPGYVCEDDIPIVLRLTADGRMWFNQTEVAPEHLESLVAKVVEFRQERVVYVMADPSVLYGQFAEFLAIVNSSEPGLHVVLLTDKFRERVWGPPVVRVHVLNNPQEYVPPCDLEWSENGFVFAPSMYTADSARVH